MFSNRNARIYPTEDPSFEGFTSYPKEDPSFEGFPSSPDFSFMFENAEMLKRAYDIIQSQDAWYLLTDFNTNTLVLKDVEKIATIITKVNESYEHTSTSFGWTMIQLNYIAMHGFDGFKAGWKKD
jgi:hypothetical protein